MKELANTINAINKPLNVRVPGKYDKVNRLIIIGNGFDLAHGLKSSFKDFLNWYLFQVLNDFFSDKSYEDELIKINSRSSDILLSILNKRNGIKAFEEFKTTARQEDIIWKSEFLHDIMNELNQKTWVDVEKYYFDYLVKKNSSNSKLNKKGYTINKLNDQFKIMKYKFVDYLKLEYQNFEFKIDQRLLDQFIGKIKRNESIYGTLKSDMTPGVTCLLNFNYTDLAVRYYERACNDHINIPIHGELDGDNVIKQEPIFGFGDELNEEFIKFENSDDESLFDHIKSIKYLEFDQYRQLDEFINSMPYQILIFGHSCGVSDRTLLNTLFENKNCISIKPFYHHYTLPEGLERDNYLKIALGIYRHFRSKQSLRSKVVNKEYCEPMVQPKKKQPQN